MEDARQVMEAVRGHRVEPAVPSSIATGVRHGELLAQVHDELDRERGIVTIRHPVERGVGPPRMSRPRSDRGVRVLVLSDRAKRALALEAEFRTREREVAGAAWVETGIVFVRAPGQVRSVVAAGHRLRACSNAAGIPPLGWHALRRMSPTRSTTHTLCRLPRAPTRGRSAGRWAASRVQVGYGPQSCEQISRRSHERMQLMHILHVYKAYPPVVGGMENHIRVLAEAQAAAGHDVSVLVVNDRCATSRELHSGVSVTRAARLAAVSSAPVSLALFREMRRLPADVTHLHCPYPIGEAAWLLRGRPPMVLTYQSDIVRQRLLGKLWAPLLRRVLARADRVLATSPAYAASSPFLRRVGDRVSIVPLGIDTDRFDGIDRRAALRRFGEGPWLVFVGRLRYYKGLDVLIDALALLPRARLLLVGSGPMEPSLRRRAADRGVAARIRWLGDVPDADLPQVLGAGEVFVLPSTFRSEAYGLAMVEAMASGLPAVSTELGTGTSWVNLDGVTGRVVPPRDPIALAGALRELLSDTALRSRMGKEARARARSEFDAAKMVERVARIYEEVTA